MKKLKPPNPKHLSEAKEANILLLRRSVTDVNGNIYICPRCGGELPLRADLVRAKLLRGDTEKWPCETCKWDEYKREAEEASLSILRKANNTHYLIYKCNECDHEQEISKQSVRDKEFKCNTCFEKKLEAEANKKNLTIVGKSSDKNFRLYKFLSCKHQTELRTSSVRNSSKKGKKFHKCWACHNEEMYTDAKAAGLILLGESSRVNNNKWYLYQADCGHVIERRADQIKRGDWRCQACIDTKLNDEAEAAGLRLVGKGKDKSFRTYEFKDCGHVKEIGTGSVRNQTFHCELCFWEDKNAILEKRGVRILGPVIQKDTRMFEFIECGHVREISFQSALDGSFVCHECEDTWYTLPSNLYLLHIRVGDEEWLKLGVAKVLESRIRQYGLPKVAVINPVKILPTTTGKEALEKESEIYHRYKSLRLDEDSMARWHRYSGYTECYPVSLKQEFITIFDNYN